MKASWLDKLYEVIDRYSKLIAIFWIILTIICSFWSLQLTNYTLFQFKPPNGYQSSIALNKLDYYFPNKTALNIELIVFEKTKKNDPLSIINKETENIYNKIKHELFTNINHKNNNLIKSLSSYYEFVGVGQSNSSAMDDLIKSKFVNEKEDMMLVILSIYSDDVSTEKLSNLINDIDKLLQSVQSKQSNGDISIKLTGSTTMFEAFLNEVKSDISGRDLLILPFVFGFMIFVLGSYKLIILPILCLLQSIVISFTFFLPFAKYKVLSVSPLTPTIMFFIIMALSVDYSLFLLSKFTSNIRNNQTVKESVKNMIDFSGHVCVLSAVILILCYLGLALFPVAGMDTIGYGTSIAIIFCATINITFTASMLLIFPNFFSDLGMVPICIYNCFNFNKTDDSKMMIEERGSYRLSKSENEKIEMDTMEMEIAEKAETESDESDDTETSISMRRGSFNQNELLECRDNFYFRMAQLVTKSPYNIIIPSILYMMMFPVIIIGFMHYKPALDHTMNLPSKSEPVHVYEKVIENFNPGILNPITVLAINNDNQHNDDIWSLSYFQHLCDLGTTLISQSHYKPSSLMSPAFIPHNNNTNLLCFGGSKDSLKTYKKAVESGQLPAWVTRIYPQFTSEIFEKYYLPYFHHSVNKEASLFTIEPNFNPYTQPNSAKILRSMIKERADNIYGDENIELYINSQTYWQLDALTDLYGRIPWALSLIIIVIFSFIGIMYGILFLPIRLFLCIIMPILFVYGITSLIYIDSGIYWLTPCMTMTVLIGLALDYELFLFSRIYDFRSNGYTNRGSIILGVALSGPIITSAGIVMSLAFCGLLLQDITASKQCGTIYVLGVLIDTFVIRPFLVPSLLSLKFNSKYQNDDKWNWYPVQMPSHDLRNEYGQLDVM